MDPLVGLILIVAWGALNALIAAKRKRSAWKFFVLSVFPVPIVVVIMARLSGGDGVITGWSAFIPPFASFIGAIAIPNGLEHAARGGEHRDYTSCPYCAEPVRWKAIRCRHCGSDIERAEDDPEPKATRT